MRAVCFGLLVALTSLTGRVNADLIFSLSPVDSQVALGSKADFQIFIRSTTDVTVGGYSLNVVAGPGDGTAGRFESGTFSFFVGDPNQSWDVASTVGQAFSTADTGAAGGSNLGSPLIANVTQLLGTVKLDTSGATLGNYSMSLDNLSAIQVNGAFIQGGVNGASFSGPVSYQITAIPEPNSLALLGLATCVLSLHRRRFAD